MAQWPKYICVCVDRAPGHLRPTPHWFSRWTSQTTPSPVWGGSRPSSAAEPSRYHSTVICLQSWRSCMAFHRGLSSDLCSLPCTRPISAELLLSRVVTFLTPVRWPWRLSTLSFVDCQWRAETSVDRFARCIEEVNACMAERHPVTLESFQDSSLQGALWRNCGVSCRWLSARLSRRRRPSPATIARPTSTRVVFHGTTHGSATGASQPLDRGFGTVCRPGFASLTMTLENSVGS